VWYKRVGRYVVGIIVAIMIWRGLDAVFAQVASDESVLGHTLRYIRYALAAFWMSYLGPLAFVRLGLAERNLK
jgi:hypothetical protein